MSVRILPGLHSAYRPRPTGPWQARKSVQKSSHKNTGTVNAMRSQKKRHNRKNARLGKPPVEPIAWCCLHRRGMSNNQIQFKKCLEKNCKHLKEFRPNFVPLYADEVEARRKENAKPTTQDIQYLAQLLKTIAEYKAPPQLNP